MIKQTTINVSSPSRVHGAHFQSFGVSKDKLYKKKSQSIIKTDSSRSHILAQALLREEIPELRRVFNEHGTLNDYVEILDEKMENTVQRQKNFLKNKYANMQAQLERTRRNIEKLKVKMIQWEKDLEENEIIKMIKADLSNYQVYMNVLKQKLDDIHENIKNEQEKISSFKEQIKVKKKTIGLVNHENIRFSSELAHYQRGLALLQQSSPHKQILNFSEIKSGAVNTTNNNIINESNVNYSEEMIVLEETERRINEESSIQVEDENANEAHIKFTEITSDETAKFRELKLNYNHLLSENRRMKSEMLQRVSNFNVFKKQYEDYFQIEERNLMKMQKIVNNTSGLSSSLLFEIKKAKTIDGVPEIEKSKSRMTSSLVNPKDRDVKTIVYETLRGLLIKQNQSRKKQDIKDFWIPWDVFKTFEPIQVMAILALRPEIQDDMKSDIHEREKIINSLMNKFKPSSPTFEI